MDVVFVEPNSAGESYQELANDYAAIETPTWALLLAQSCRSKGYNVDILDANAERLNPYAVAVMVNDLSPKLCLFVVYGQNPNSGTVNMAGAIKEAIAIKEMYPDTLIGFVGSYSSALPRKVMEHECVDVVFTNEGVYALHNLLSQLRLDDPDLGKVNGIGWRSRNRDTRWILNKPERLVPSDRMDEDLPGYAWDLLPYNKKPFDLYRAHFWYANYESNSTPFAAIYTSLGCRFQCNFCMINILNRTNNDEDSVSSDFNVMRFWSPENIIKEFDKLAE